MNFVAERDARLKERLKVLVGDALIVAGNAGFDVFNALTLMDNVDFLEDLKVRFGILGFFGLWILGFGFFGFLDTLVFLYHAFSKTSFHVLVLFFLMFFLSHSYKFTHAYSIQSFHL